MLGWMDHPMQCTCGRDANGSLTDLEKRHDGAGAQGLRGLEHVGLVRDHHLQGHVGR